jgi:hypothetical protein
MSSLLSIEKAVDMWLKREVTGDRQNQACHMK